MELVLSYVFSTSGKLGCRYNIELKQPDVEKIEKLIREWYKKEAEQLSYEGPEGSIGFVCRLDDKVLYSSDADFTEEIFYGPMNLQRLIAELMDRKAEFQKITIVDGNKDRIWEYTELKPQEKTDTLDTLVEAVPFYATLCCGTEKGRKIFENCQFRVIYDHFWAEKKIPGTTEEFCMLSMGAEKVETETRFSPTVLAVMEEIKKNLYTEEQIPDDAVVQQIYEVKKRMEKENKQVIPNFVFMGPPGCGKTTLAKHIAVYFGNNRDLEHCLIERTPSDLKGAHVGHTQNRVYDLIVEAVTEDKSIYIDEAYDLQKDDFGKEAVDILLPVLSGDRDVIERTARKKKKKDTGKAKESGKEAEQDPEVEQYSFSKNGKNPPPIWFGGYEHEMRKMLSENSGLYRRMIPIVLTPPSVSQLFEYLCKLAKGNEVCIAVFQKYEKELRRYFDWGMRPEHIEYFASFAGVKSLYQTAELYLEDIEDEKKILLWIIGEKKKEIKKQYMAVLSDFKQDEFEITTDISVQLSDVIGNEKVVSKLKEIVYSIYDSVCGEELWDLPKGVLLTGVPGVGKTFLARAVAGEMQKLFEENAERNRDTDFRVAFIELMASELQKNEKMEHLFEVASEYDCSIILLEEIEAIGKRRDGSGAMPQLLLSLIKEIDKIKEDKHIFVIATAQERENLDEALLCPGRLEYVFELELPNQEDRRRFLKKYISELALWDTVSEEELQKLQYYREVSVHEIGDNEYEPREYSRAAREPKWDMLLPRNGRSEEPEFGSLEHIKMMNGSGRNMKMPVENLSVHFGCSPADLKMLVSKAERDTMMRAKDGEGAVPLLQHALFELRKAERTLDKIGNPQVVRLWHILEEKLSELSYLLYGEMFREKEVTSVEVYNVLGYARSSIRMLINNSELDGWTGMRFLKEAWKYMQKVEDKIPGANRIQRFFIHLNEYSRELLEEKEGYCYKREFGGGYPEKLSVRAVHQLGHFYVKRFLCWDKTVDKISIVYREDTPKYADWWKKTAKNQTEMIAQIATCLGGKLLEEMFYKDAFSLEAVRDEKTALKYASEMLDLYGRWKNKTTAEDVVEEVYLQMKEPLWKYDGTACLYRLARALYNKEF